MPQYRIVSASVDWSTGIATEKQEFPANDLSFSETLNAPGGMSFTVPVRHPKCTRDNLNPGRDEIHIYRDDDMVWGGYLWTAEASDEKDVRFGGEGYWSRMRRRYVDVDKVYTDTDQFDIVRDLVDFTQGQTMGQLGWTHYSMTDSGILRDAEYKGYERRYIGEIVEEMASWFQGFDFEVTVDKKLRLYYPSKGTIQPNVVFELGKNIGGLSYSIDAQNVASEYSALGGGDGSSTCIATVFDATSRSTYGLLETAQSFSDIKFFADLQGEATQELNMVKDPRWQPQLSVHYTDDLVFPDLSLGDTVRVRADWGYINLDDQFRVIAITQAINNQGREATTVFMDDRAAPV